MEASRSFGQFVKQRRRALGLAQAELARQIGYSAIALRKVEADERRPSRQMALKLVAHLEIAPEQREAFLRLARMDARDGESRPEPEPAPLRDSAGATSFVGRQREIAEVTRLLGDTRLLTLTGTGGCGKSRLAIQVGMKQQGRFRDGARIVELAPLADPSLVPDAVAAVLGVRDTSGASPLASLVAGLRDREVLLILDNCEHLREACARLTEALLRDCPGLRVLTTSRQYLGVVEEVAWRVPSLSLPNPRQAADATSVGQSEAVQLFVDRARGALPGFTLTDRDAPSVAQICWRLDGIPLAIELAAARARMLTVAQIATRLDDRFRLLTGGSRTAPTRHQTLRGTLDWSYDLLTEAERALLRRLGVFAGGFSLEAAEAVCAGEPVLAADVLDLLTSLTDQSLVVVDNLDGEETRYRLPETIRQYAREQSLAHPSVPAAPANGRAGSRDCGEAATRARHRDWYLEFAERASKSYFGPEQRVWLDRLDREHDNLRAALAWCLEAGEPEPGMRLADALDRFWYFRGHEREASTWLQQVLALSANLGDDARLRPARARLLAHAGAVAMRQDELDRAAPLLEASLATRRALGDAEFLVRGLFVLGQCRLFQNRHDEARALLIEARDRARCAGYDFGVIQALNLLGNVAFAVGELADAWDAFEEAASISREVHLDQQLARSLEWLGNVALAEGRTEEARTYYEQSLSLNQATGVQVGVAHALLGLGLVAVERGDADHAERLLRECLDFQRESSDRPFVPATLDGLAGVAACRVPTFGSPAAERALRLAGAASASRGILGKGHHWHSALAIRWLAPAYVALGGPDSHRAEAAWEAGRALTQEQAMAYALEESAAGRTGSIGLSPASISRR